MKAQIERAYTYIGIPPRCRNPRQMTDRKMFDIEVKEMTEEDFPIAYTVTQERWTDSEPIVVQFRADGDNLFIPHRYFSDRRDDVFLITGSEDLAAFAKNEIHNHEEEDIIRLSIKEFEEEVRIFDGKIWFSTGEPYYEMQYSSTFYSSCPTFNIHAYDISGKTKESIYRADEKPLLERYYDEYFDNARAAHSDIRKVQEEEDYIKNQLLRNNFIEVGDVFVTKLQSRETRLMEALYESIDEYVKKMFGTYYLPEPEDDKVGAIQFLKDCLFKKIWESEEYKKEGNLLLNELFYKSLFEVLTEFTKSQKMVDGMYKYD